MNQFLVPQNIDVEPKILGPLTLKQFIIVVCGIVAAVICYKFADFALFIFELIIIAIIVILFAFIRINGQPFNFFLLNIFAVVVGSNIRIWTKDANIAKSIEDKVVTKKDSFFEKEEIRSQKLSELSLLLDTGGAFQAEEEKEEDVEKLRMDEKE